MFQTVSISKNKKEGPSVDISYLIDSILLYDKVILFVHRNELELLFNSISKSTIRELILSRRIELKFRDNMIGVIKAPNNQFGINIFSSTTSTLENVLYEIDRKKQRNSILNNKFVDEFSDLIGIYQFSNTFYEDIVRELKNTSLIKKQLITYLENKAPFYNLPEKIDFNIIDKGDFYSNKIFEIQSNIDLLYINEELKKKNIPDYYEITWSDFLVPFASSKGDILIASDFESEIITSELNSKFIEINFSDIINRGNKSNDERKIFEDYVLEDCYSLGTAFVNKIITEKELLKILEESDKFRDWLHKIPEEKSLMGEYYKIITKKSFRDKLPPKIIRFAFFEGIGIALDYLGTGRLGTIIATLTSAFDNFVLDRIIKGKWKPNIFIDEVLKPKIKQK